MKITSVASTILEPVGGVASAVASPNTFREAVWQKLGEIADVAAIVGTHIYPGVLPRQHSLDRDGPALTFSITMDRNMGRGIAAFGHHLRGSDGTVLHRVQVSAWSYAFTEVDALSEALYAALDGVWNTTWGTIPIMSCVREQEIDLPEAPTGDRTRTIYQIASEFHVRNRNTAAIRD